jgi:predicted nucleic acid-binding Zn ribbon protein
VTCFVCGLELPAQARFCARCGTRQGAARREVEAWVFVVFGLGVALSAVVSVLYAVIAIDPAGASTTMDPSVVRTGSVTLAVIVAVVCFLQVGAIVGLVRGGEWGRVLATIVCVAWSLTCVGLPVAALVLNSIWRRRPAPGGLTAPGALF